MDKELEKLKTFVSGSAEYTKSQLQSIDSNLLIGSIVSLIISLGISIYSNILIFWIPSSFILMLLWFLYAITFGRRRLNKQTSNVSNMTLSQKQIFFGNYTFFRNFFHIQNSIGIMFGITFISLALYISKIIATGIQFSTLIPFISTSVILICLIFINYYISNLHDKEIPFSDAIIKIPTVAGSGCKGCIFVGIAFLLASFIFLGLPIWTLIVTSPIYSLYNSTITNIPLLILVIALQAIVIAAFSSYLSSIAVKKELINALTNYSRLDNLIDQHIINKTIDDNKYKELLDLYYQAKRFDLTVDDYFKIVNFYLLVPNKTYFDNLK